MNEDYYFYKSCGICIACHHRDAMYGAVRCDVCAEKLADRDSKRYAKLKSSEEYVRYRKNQSDKRRELRNKRRMNGICPSCGKRPPHSGKSRCIDCIVSSRRKKDNRYHNEIPRSERHEHEMCYICGEVVKDGYRLCEKHYDRLTLMAKYYCENPTQPILEQRKRFGKGC